MSTETLNKQGKITMVKTTKTVKELDVTVESLQKELEDLQGAIRTGSEKTRNLEAVVAELSSKTIATENEIKRLHNVIQNISAGKVNDYGSGVSRF